MISLVCVCMWGWGEEAGRVLPDGESSIDVEKKGRRTFYLKDVSWWCVYIRTSVSGMCVRMPVVVGGSVCVYVSVCQVGLR